MSISTKGMFQAILLIFCACAQLHSQASGWRKLPNGLEIYQGSPSLTALRVDLQRFDLSTVNPLEALPPRGGGSYSYSLQDLADNTNALALLNGGDSANASLSIPRGLLRTNGVLLEPRRDFKNWEDGIFCVTESGQADVIRADTDLTNTHLFDKCKSAVQAGPILISAGGKVISESEYDLPYVFGIPDRVQRSAVAVDTSGRVLLIVSGPVTASEFADHLVQLNSVLHIGVALNLGLYGYSSGLMYQPGKRQYQQIGAIKTLIGSAILVQASRGEHGGPTLRKVSIPAKERWTDTFVEVRRGEAVSFSATGQIQWSNREDAKVGPDGSSWKLTARVGSYPVRDMGAGGLIGKIGKEGKPFAVGKGKTMVATTNGTIYLGINDNFFRENSGEFQVTITKP